MAAGNSERSRFVPPPCEVPAVTDFLPTRIRPAVLDDIPDLIELLAGLFAIESDFVPNRARQRRGLELLLAQPTDRARVLVACSGKAIAGMASGQLVVSTAEGAVSAWIEDVVVQESLRRRGIAKGLLHGLLDWAAYHGATRAQLLADKDNATALDFYRHLGWRQTQLSAWRHSLHAH